MSRNVTYRWVQSEVVISVAESPNTFLERYKKLRENVNWEIKEERIELLSKIVLWGFHRMLTALIPNLRDIFRIEEIDRLILDAAINCQEMMRDGSPETFLNTLGGSFIHFLATAGYKDEPKLDENGKPMLHRYTALHYAGKAHFRTNGVRVVQDLFKIYDMNYTNDVGYSHFHVACEFSIVEAIRRFLELGQDPNVPDDGVSPLQKALYRNRGEVAELLLGGGANPNWIGKYTTTPLHILISSRINNGAFAERFFKIIKEMNQLVDVNLKNENNPWCCTPLESAVASLLPNVVDLLLDNGADLSSFVFPPEGFIDARISRRDDSKFVKLRLASGALGIVECFQKRGYELNHSCVLAIMKLFAKYEWFDKSSALEKPWCDDKKFMRTAKMIMVKPSLSFYDLIQLQPEKAEKLLTPRDYFELVSSRKLNDLSETHAEACALRLSEIMSRKFFRRWARDPLVELMGHRLPNLCCDMVNEQLTNEDLYNIFLAAAGHSS